MRNITETLNEALLPTDSNVNTVAKPTTFDKIFQRAVNGLKLNDPNYEREFNSYDGLSCFGGEFKTSKEAIAFIKKHKNDIISHGTSEWNRIDGVYDNMFEVDDVEISIPTLRRIFKRNVVKPAPTSKRRTLDEIGYDPLKPQNKTILKRVIKERIKQFGNNCDLNDIDVSGITDMGYLFYKSKFNGDISHWDVSNVENMNCMFANTKFNGDISNWNVSNTKNMSYMFYDSVFDGDISKWDVSNVTNMNNPFSDSFTGDLSKWDVSNVTNMDCLFRNAKKVSDISNWDIHNVKSMWHMFEDATVNVDISKWDMSNVKNAEEMFCGATVNVDLSKWDLSKVKNTKDMFRNCNIKESYKPKLNN